jgi:hypothetical protein
MKKKRALNQEDLDNRLANFVDRALASENNEEAWVNADDPELQALAKTVLHLKQSLGPPETDQAMAIRVQNRLAKTFRDEMAERKPTTATSRWRAWLNKLGLEDNRANRPVILGLAMAAAALALAILWLPGRPSGLEGTAGGGASIVLVLAVGLLMAFMVWLWRHRR